MTVQALVVFESMFGNTQRIAEAVADGLSTVMGVDVVEVGAAPTEIAGVELLVVGGPTQAFGMSRAGTRQAASKQSDHRLVSPGRGLREWLNAIRGGGANVAAAAFDTRFDKPRWLTGSAARAAEKRLRRLGFRIVVPSASFFVTETKGPLSDGELDRAQRWGAELGSAVLQETTAAQET
jgi:hypothetical protein